MSSTCLDIPASASDSNLCGKCGHASLTELLSQSCGSEDRPRSPASVEDDSFWIQCDLCELWYHGKCVEVEEYEGVLIEHYHCPDCSVKKGPSILKPVFNRHRYKFYENDADYKPPEIGTEVWVKNFKQSESKIPDGSDRVRYFDSGHQLSSQWLEKTKWDCPVIVKKTGGLGLRVLDYSLEEIVEKLGEMRGVDVIDVQIQHSFRMTLGRFLKHWNEKPRKRLYNLISLEVSRTCMNDDVKIPDVVEEISWVHTFWPRDTESAGGEVLHEHLGLKPDVGKFCLIGMKDSFTDFHIDFGGSSVWYHVVRGKKIFYVIEPSDRNLAMFEQHGTDPDRHEKFFGFELPESECRRVVIHAGETFFIPSGWIHGVYTPVDSLVYGGNFLHSLHIPMQLCVSKMEERLNTDDRFMFPNFKVCCWYAARHLAEVFHDANDSKSLMENHLLEGARELVAALKEWVKQEKGSKRKTDSSLIVGYGKTARSLQKEASAQEKLKNDRKLKPQSPKKAIKTPAVPTKPEITKSDGSVPNEPRVVSGSKQQKQGRKKKHSLKLKLKTPVPPPPLKLKLNLSEPSGKTKTPSPVKQSSSSSPSPSEPDTPGFRFCNINPNTSKLFTESQETSIKLHSETDPSSQPVGFSLMKLQQKSEGTVGKGLSLLIRKQSRPLVSPIKIAMEIEAAFDPKKGSLGTSASTGLDISGIFGTSSHGRVQKPSKWVTGGAQDQGSDTSTEFVPELGQHCHTDADFVYPSLIDSDTEESGSRPKTKKRKTTEGPQTIFKIKEEGDQRLEEDLLIAVEEPLSQPSGTQKPTVSKEAGEPKPKKKIAGSTAKQRLANKMKLHRFNIPL